ncbi:MAG: PAS domain S-box protein [Cytophagales bacterium]|nr:MAG: PAS domain S-box protein [Cytophagales bacterium]
MKNLINSFFQLLRGQKQLTSLQYNLLGGFLLSVFLVTLIIAIMGYKVHLANVQKEYFQTYKIQLSQHIDQILKNNTEILYLLRGNVHTLIHESNRKNRQIAALCREIWSNKTLESKKNLYTLLTSISEEEEGFESLRQTLDKQFVRFSNALNNSYKALQKGSDLVKQRNKIEASTKYDYLIVYNESLEQNLLVELTPIQRETEKTLYDILQRNNLRLKASEKNYEDIHFLLNIVALILFLSTCFIAAYATYILYRNIKNDLYQYTGFAQKINKGNIPDRIQTESAEFKLLTEALNGIRKEMKQLQTFATQIAEGNYETNITLFAQQGDIGKSLSNMQESLRNLSEENRIRYWRNNGIALFSQVMRDNAENVEKLARTLIKQLVDYLELQQGAFFIVQKDHNESTPYLRLLASFAFNQDDFKDKKILQGQGLLGQAWKDKEVMYLRKIPENYIQIVSGLGSSQPRAVLILPLMTTLEVQAVIELASFKDIPEYKISFAEEIAHDAAATVAVALNNANTKDLLKSTQELALNLRAKEKQLQQNLFELKAAQKNMQYTQQALAAKEANLEAVVNNTSDAILAFDKNYNITVINKTMRILYLEEGINLQVGKNILQELPQEEIDKHISDYKRVLEGEKFEVMRSSQKDEHEARHYLLHYNPIRDEESEVIGASIFIENITQEKNAQDAFKNTQAYLHSIINDTEDTIIAINTSYQIIIANEKYKATIEEKGLNYQPNAPIFTLMHDSEAEQWREYFHKALAGERFIKVIESQEAGKRIFTEHWFNPIRDEIGNIMGVSVLSHDITLAKQAEIKTKQMLLDALETNDQMRNNEKLYNQKMQEYEAKITLLEKKLREANIK